MPEEARTNFRHIDYSRRAKPRPYTAKGGGAKDFKLVPRQRAAHAEKLRGDLRAIEGEAARLYALQEFATYEEDAGINLEIRGRPGYPLAVEPFDAAPKFGIALKNVREETTEQPDGSIQVTVVATVFVRHGKLTFLVKRIEDYASERQTVVQMAQGKAKSRNSTTSR